MGSIVSILWVRKLRPKRKAKVGRGGQSAGPRAWASQGGAEQSLGGLSQGLEAGLCDRANTAPTGHRPSAEVPRPKRGGDRTLKRPSRRSWW